MSVGEHDGDVIGWQVSANDCEDTIRETLPSDKTVLSFVSKVTVEMGTNSDNAIDRNKDLRLLYVSVDELERYGLEKQIDAEFTNSGHFITCLIGEEWVVGA